MCMCMCMRMCMRVAGLGCGEVGPSPTEGHILPHRAVGMRVWVWVWVRLRLRLRLGVGVGVRVGPDEPHAANARLGAAHGPWSLAPAPRRLGASFGEGPGARGHGPSVAEGRVVGAEAGVGGRGGADALQRTARGRARAALQSDPWPLAPRQAGPWALAAVQGGLQRRSGSAGGGGRGEGGGLRRVVGLGRRGEGQGQGVG